MNFIKQMKISRAIMLVATIPLIVAIFFAAQIILKEHQTVNELQSLERLTALAVKMSNLVHEQQKERGATAGFLSSGGKKFSSELRTQREDTNKKRQAFLDYAETMDLGAYGSGFKRDMENLLSSLNQMNSIRSQVDSFSVAAPKAIGYYTGLNRQNLKIISSMALLSSNAGVTNYFHSYVNFLKSKERAGVERAVGAGSFAKGSFSPKALNKFKKMIAIQDTYINAFLDVASKEQQEYYSSTLRGNAVDEVNRMRQVAINTPGDTSSVDGTYWFDTITQKIGQLKKIENKLAADLETLMVDTKHEVQTEEMWNIIITAIALLITILLSVLIVRTLNSAFSAVIHSMTELAEGNLKTELPEHTNNEIGEMVKALEIFQDNGLKAEEMRAQQEREQEEKQQRTERVESLVQMFEEKASTAVNTVASAATQLHQTADSMGKQITGASQKSIEVATASGETSANVQSVASAAEEMSVSVKEIAEQMQTANQAVNDSADKAKAAGQSAEMLQKASDSISQIAQMIEDIAGQINLLALNATIESARAGEAGKGFAVVAGEVKNLANQTAKATDEIGKEISNIQEVAREVVSVLGSVQESISSVTESSSAVASAVEEQTAVTNEISSNMQTASTGVDNISRNIDDIASSTKEADEATKQVQDAARMLSEQSEILNREVQEFLEGIKTA